VRISRALAAEGISSCRFDFSGSGESEGHFAGMTIATMQSDCLSAVRYIRRHYAPSHVILLGHSLGGLITSLCCNEAAADGLILISPVADPMGLVMRRQRLIEAGPNKDGYYENGPHEMSLSFLDSLEKIDPLQSLTGYRGPLLLFQGDGDQSISVKESGRYIHWARRMGIDAEYHILRGADHNYSTVSHVKTLCNSIERWAKEHYL